MVCFYRYCGRFWRVFNSGHSTEKYGKIRKISIFQIIQTLTETILINEFFCIYLSTTGVDKSHIGSCLGFCLTEHIHLSKTICSTFSITFSSSTRYCESISVPFRPIYSDLSISFFPIITRFTAHNNHK